MSDEKTTETTVEAGKTDAAGTVLDLRPPKNGIVY